MEVTDSDKHSNLLRLRIYYARIKFYYTSTFVTLGPGDLAPMLQTVMPFFTNVRNSLESLSMESLSILV